MLLQNNNLFKGLISLLFFPLFLFASYYSIYDKTKPRFVYSFENGDYKVTIKQTSKIDYATYDGFKFYLPNFVKSYNLQVLRTNSIGYINGYLSIHPYFQKSKLISKNPTDIQYYYTDYNTYYRQLDFLLNGKIIFYPKMTSLAIEAYHIPPSKKLNTYLYFTFVNAGEKNKLKSLVYSFSMTFHKKELDKFVKLHFKTIIYKKERKFDYLNTYLMSLNKKITPIIKKNIVKVPLKPIIVIDNLPKPKKKKIVHKQKKQPEKKKTKIVSKKKKIEFHLYIKRIFYMMDYPFVNKELKIDTNENEIMEANDTIMNLKEAMDNLKIYLNKELNKKVLLFPKDVLKIVNNYYYSFGEIDTLPPLLKKMKVDIPKCYFDDKKINKECFKNKDYFYDYTYFLGFKNKIPTNEEIIGFGDYRVFNRVGIYYFRNGDFEQAKKFFFKSYVLAPENKKGVVSHNLATLYHFRNRREYTPKIIKYLKESGLGVDYYNIAIYYYIGLGVPESDKLARKFFQMAADLGFEKATENIKIMNKYKIGLTPTK